MVVKFKKVFSWLLVGVLFTLLCLVTRPAMAAPSEKEIQAQFDQEWAENQLLEALKAIYQNQPDRALQQLTQLTASFPNYRLAHLIKGDLLAIRAGQYQNLLLKKREKKAILALMSEAKVRWKTTAQDQMMSDKLLDRFVLKANSEPYLVIVNASLHRLFVYRQQKNGYEELANYYISIGRKGMGKRQEGDLKTPSGIYRILSHLGDEELPELYGVGALTLDYPNVWDQAKGRTGSGIWLHGTPRNTFSRPPMSSRGCVVLNNGQMATLLEQFQLPANTPVLLTEALPDWQYYMLSEKYQVVSEIQRWFVSRHPDVDWQDVSVFRYPNEPGLYQVTYRKNNQFVDQYWRKRSTQSEPNLALDSSSQNVMVRR